MFKSRGCGTPSRTESYWPTATILPHGSWKSTSSESSSDHTLSLSHDEGDRLALELKNLKVLSQHTELTAPALQSFNLDLQSVVKLSLKEGSEGHAAGILNLFLSVGAIYKKLHSRADRVSYGHEMLDNLPNLQLPEDFFYLADLLISRRPTNYDIANVLHTIGLIIRYDGASALNQSIVKSIITLYNMLSDKNFLSHITVREISLSLDCMGSIALSGKLEGQTLDLGLFSLLETSRIIDTDTANAYIESVYFSVFALGFIASKNVSCNQIDSSIFDRLFDRIRYLETDKISSVISSLGHLAKANMLRGPLYTAWLNRWLSSVDVSRASPSLKDAAKIFYGLGQLYKARILAQPIDIDLIQKFFNYRHDAVISISDTSRIMHSLGLMAQAGALAKEFKVGNTFTTSLLSQICHLDEPQAVLGVSLTFCGLSTLAISGNLAEDVCLDHRSIDLCFSQLATADIEFSAKALSDLGFLAKFKKLSKSEEYDFQALFERLQETVSSQNLHRAFSGIKRLLKYEIKVAATFKASVLELLLNKLAAMVSTGKDIADIFDCLELMSEAQIINGKLHSDYFVGLLNCLLNIHHASLKDYSSIFYDLALLKLEGVLSNMIPVKIIDDLLRKLLNSLEDNDQSNRLLYSLGWLKQPGLIQGDLDQIILNDFYQWCNYRCDDEIAQCHVSQGILGAIYLGHCLSNTELKILGSFKSTPSKNQIKLCNKLNKRRIYAEPEVLLEGHFVDIYFEYNEKKYIVELDGPHHQQRIQQHKDQMRDGFLKSKGYELLRYPCKDKKSIAKIFEHITQTIGLPNSTNNAPTKTSGKRSRHYWNSSSLTYFSDSDEPPTIKVGRTTIGSGSR